MKKFIESLTGWMNGKTRQRQKFLPVFKTTITKEEMENLPFRSFEGVTYLADDAEASDKAIRMIQGRKVLGFDTETKPAFKKGLSYNVSLLQLSGKEDAFLFRLKSTGISDKLKEILEDPEILKVGVAIHDDIKALQKIRSFKPGGFIELQSFVKEFEIMDNGLKKLTSNILGFRISKRQQTSDWNTRQLSEAQINYAATDAWVCYEIFDSLARHVENSVIDQYIWKP